MAGYCSYGGNYLATEAGTGQADRIGETGQGMKGLTRNGSTMHFHYKADCPRALAILFDRRLYSSVLSTTEGMWLSLNLSKTKLIQYYIQCLIDWLMGSFIPHYLSLNSNLITHPLLLPHRRPSDSAVLSRSPAQSWHAGLLPRFHCCSRGSCTCWIVSFLPSAVGRGHV
jgi:hypothetical protein